MRPGQAAFRFVSAVLACAVAAACGPSTQTASTPATDRPALVLTPEPGADFGDDTAFGRSVAARYAEAMPSEAIAADLRAQGFACEALAPVEATAAYGLFTCSRADPAGPCFDTYVVRIAHDPRREDDAATAEGDYARRCLGASPS